MLNTHELETAKTVINKGLKSGAKQLSFFMKEDIHIAEVALTIEQSNAVKPLNRIEIGQQPIYLLLTTIVGELGGRCYLIFTQPEVDQLRAAALPPAMAEKQPAIYEKMKDAILLEVDNIIAASVVTEFANLFEVNIHGSVPTLECLDKEAAAKLLSQEANKTDHIIDFKAQFSTKNASFSPLFVWYLDQSFVNAIKIHPNVHNS